MTLLWIVLLPLFGSLMALLGRNLPRSYLALVVALFPISALALLLQLLPAVLAGQVLSYQLDWLPLLGLSFTLQLDGLSLLFALLILGIGLLAGTVFGVAQQLRGAHFLSHDVASLIVCWAVACTVDAVGTRSGRAPVPEARA